jgi:hypothetical protein
MKITTAISTLIGAVDWTRLLGYQTVVTPTQ